MSAALRGAAFVVGVFLTTFFAALALRTGLAFFVGRCFAVSFGLAALRAGAFALAPVGFGRADFALIARLFPDFAVVLRAVVRDVERLRPFARVLMN